MVRPAPVLGRFFAILAIFAGLAWCVYANYVMSPVSGTWGFSGYSQHSDGRIIVIERVWPHSPASAAGIEPGDIVHSPTIRNLLVEFPTNGERLTFTVSRAGVSRAVTLTAAPDVYKRYWTDDVLFACEVLSLLLALLLAIRSWEQPAARALILYFACQAITLAPFADNAVYVYLRPLQLLLIFASFAALIRFTSIYPPQARTSRLRSSFAFWAPLAVAVVGVAFLLSSVGDLWFSFESSTRTAYRYASLIAADILPVIGFIGGLMVATVSERKRLIVLVAFNLVGLSGPVAYEIILAHTSISSYAFRPLLATLLIMYVGFVYVILRHRLFDIGFVLNRATIYAALTIVLVPIFALLEWLAESYVSSQGRTENLLIQGGIVIVLFTLMRSLHQRTEHFVDTTLFRKRYEDETALRAFARQVVFMTDSQSVSEKAVHLVCGRSDASWVSLYTKGEGDTAYRQVAHSGESSAPDEIDENDFAVTAMLAERAPVDHQRYSELADALLLPCIAHAKLVGFLACGPKHGGEFYAPDEREALAEVARAIGITFDALRLASLEREVARLRERAPSAAVPIPGQ